MSDLAIIYRTAGVWGAGIERKLTNVEVDSNFYALEQAYQALLVDRPEPVQISSISVAGRFMSVQMANDTVFGPFPLPITEFRFRDEWQPLTVYDPLDWFTVAGVGIFTVIYGHTSGPEFDPAIQVSDLPALKKIGGADLTSTANSTVYDVEFLYEGHLSDIEGPLNFLAVRSLTLPASGVHSAYIATPAAAADQVLEILHNTSVIGHVTFPAGENVGTVELINDETLGPGDRLALGPPATADGVAKQMTVAFALQRILTA